MVATDLGIPAWRNFEEPSRPSTISLKNSKWQFSSASYAVPSGRARGETWGSIANKKLITESSQAKKLHAGPVPLPLSRGLSVIGSPFSVPSAPLPFPGFDANPILPANNVGSCPDEPECKLLCVNKISAAGARTLCGCLIRRSLGK